MPRYEQPRVVNNISRLYHTALGITALLSIVAQIYLQTYLYQLSFEAREINLSGKMRTLSQATVKYALLIEDNPQNLQYRTDLADTIEEFDRIFTGLSQGDSGLRVRPLQTEEGARLFKATEPLLRETLAAADNLVFAEDDAELLANAKVIKQNDDLLLAAVSQVPTYYDRIGREAIDFLRVIELVLLALTLLVLALEWRFLLRPIDHLAEALISRLEEAARYAKLASTGGMSAGIAHEINSPLAAMLLNIQRLRRTLQRSQTVDQLEVVEQLTRALESGERVADIVKSVRALADNKLPQQKTKVFAVDLFGKEEREIRKLTGGKDVKFTTRRGSEKVEVWCVDFQIQQALRVLMINAVESVANQPDPWVELSATEEGETTELVVRDSGTGIPEESLSRIFDPFYTTKDIGSGMGLGLAQCERIATLHGGSVRYELVGGHTAFVISLPTPH